MALYQAFYYCTFCDADYEETVNSYELSQPKTCEDCYRTMSLQSSERIGAGTDNNNNNNNNQALSPSADTLATFMNEFQQNMMQRDASNTLRPTSDARHVALIHVIQRLLENAGPMLEGETQGTHPDFIQYLKDNTQQITPYQSHTLGLYLDVYPTELIIPTVAEFGIQYKELIDILTYMEHSALSQQNENDDGDDDDDETTNNKKQLTTKELDIMEKFIFQQYDESMHNNGYITGSQNFSDIIPDGSTILAQTSLFLPPPDLPLTGKGMNLEQYTMLYNQYINQYSNLTKKKKQFEINTGNNNNNNTEDDDDDDENYHTNPPICTFQRGDISFGAKTLLMPTKANIMKKNNNNNNNSLNINTTYPTIMLCGDTNTNPAQWPFIMTDSAKIADQTQLCLMISQSTSNIIFNKIRTLQKQQQQQNPPCKALLLITPNEAMQCSICKCAFETGDDYVKLKCKHLYHQGCILQWLEKKNSCPVCRYQLPAKMPIDDDAHEPVNNTNYRDFFM